MAHQARGENSISQRRHVATSATHARWCAIEHCIKRAMHAHSVGKALLVDAQHCSTLPCQGNTLHGSPPPSPGTRTLPEPESHTTCGSTHGVCVLAHLMQPLIARIAPPWHLMQPGLHALCVPGTASLALHPWHCSLHCATPMCLEISLCNTHHQAHEGLLEELDGPPSVSLLRALLLNTDLHKVARGSLPEDVNRAVSAAIKGPHVLQVRLGAV